MGIKIKKSLHTVEPERGLRDLAGSRRSERSEGATGIRLSGNYVSVDHSKSGNFFGITAFILATVSSIGILFSATSGSVSATTIFISAGLVAVHPFAMVADNIGSTKIPWAALSLKVFWSIAGSIILLWIAINLVS